MTIRNFQPGDERAQAALYNGAAFALPGFKAATEDDHATRARALYRLGCLAREAGNAAGAFRLLGDSSACCQKRGDSGPLEISLKFAACSDKDQTCLPPVTVKVPAP